MPEILPSLLNDTLNLVSLARETALTRGDQAKADRLTPLVDDLREVVTDANKPNSVHRPSGLLATEDFRTLLETVQNGGHSASSTSSHNELHQIIMAMAAGGMADLEIARQMGISSEEVRLFASLSQNPSKTSSPSQTTQGQTISSAKLSKSQLSDAYLGWNHADKEVTS